MKKFQLFDMVNYIFLLLVGIAMLYPFVNIIAISFSSYEAYLENPLRIFPKGWNFEAYTGIIHHVRFYTSYLNTFIITSVGVIAGLFLYVITAYPLSKKDLKGRRWIMLYIVFTMMFNGGLIPNFLVMRELKLYDTLAVLIFKGMFTAYNLILIKSFFESLPESIVESAKIDGASEVRILFKIIVPLSKPILATIALFSAVAYWNNYYNAVVYIRSVDKWPLMLFLREIIMGAQLNEIADSAEMGRNTVEPIMLQYSTLLLVILPIICVYPFLQKYFVKGIMLGSVKG